MKPRNYVALSGGIFAASWVGFWILFFVLPDVRPLSTFERVLWVVSLALMLPTLPLILPAGIVMPPGSEISGMLISSVISALFWPFLISRIRRRSGPKDAELDAIPIRHSADTSAGPKEEFRRLLDEHRKRNS